MANRLLSKYHPADQHQRHKPGLLSVPRRDGRTAVCHGLGTWESHPVPLLAPALRTGVLLSQGGDTRPPSWASSLRQELRRVGTAENGCRKGAWAQACKVCSAISPILLQGWQKNKIFFKKAYPPPRILPE